MANTKTDKVVEVEEVEPVYVRDYRKKVFNTITGLVTELDDDTADTFAKNPNFYSEIRDANNGLLYSVRTFRWGEGFDGPQVGS
jgi:hypothetical protein